MSAEIVEAINGLGLGAFGTLLVIILFYIVLGCFMETFSMLLTTTPLVAPIIVALGYDPVWWGILLTVLLETALITAPDARDPAMIEKLSAVAGRVLGN